MAARRWRENEAALLCHDCGGPISARRLALKRKCCAKCAGERAKAESLRRRRRKLIPPP